MISIKDFSSWSTYDGLDAGSGRSEKEWLISDDGTIGLFKYPKNDPSTGQCTTEYISEHLAYQLGKLLDVETAIVDIGYRNGRIGSMSYQINKPDESIIEGVHFISGVFPSFNVDKMLEEETGDYYYINHIFNSTPSVMQDDWIEMMVFDFLIGNRDRHQSNWAILASFSQKEEPKITIKRCPLYDNGSSLCCYENERKIDLLTGPDLGPFRALTDSKSRSIIRIDPQKKTLPTHRMVMQYLLKSYPITNTIATRFVDRLTETNIDQLLNEYPADVLTTKKSRLIKRFLLEKASLLTDLLREEASKG